MEGKECSDDMGRWGKTFFQAGAELKRPRADRAGFPRDQAPTGTSGVLRELKLWSTQPTIFPRAGAQAFSGRTIPTERPHLPIMRSLLF